MSLVPTDQRIAALPAFQPANVPEVMQLASVFAASGLFPGVKDQAQAAVKILAGLELGMGPVSAMNNLDIIAVSNRPPRLRPNADAQAHLARRAGYEYQVVEHSTTKCVLEWSRYGDTLGKSEFSMDEAKAAGLVKDFGGYKAWPKNMMLARAITQGIKTYCRFILAAPVAGMEVVTPEEVESGPLTDDSRKRLFAVTPRSFDREERLQLVSDIVGRDISSYKDLTEGEARFAADVLEQRGDIGIDPVEAMEAEGEFDPFANVDGNEEIKGSAGIGSTKTIGGEKAADNAPPYDGRPRPIPAEQHTQGSAVSAGGPRAGTLEGPDAAPAGQIKGSAEESGAAESVVKGGVPVAGMSVAPRTPPASAEQVSGVVGESGSSPSLSSTPEKLPLKVETKVQAHQRMASTTRHKGESPAAPDALGRVRAAAEAGPSAPMGSAVGSEQGEGEGGRVVSEGGDANSGDPSPAWTTTERTPTDPLHWLAPNDGVELIQKCRDDADVARSTIEGWMGTHGLKSLDDPKDYAEFLRVVLRRKVAQ